MKILFEELNESQRAGGIETATRGLIGSLIISGATVWRSSPGWRDRDEGGAPDCVHVHGIWAPRLMKRCRSWSQRRLPLMISPHGMLEPWALAHKGLKKRLAWPIYQKRILQRANCLHATSQYEGENLRRLGLTAPIAIIPWGVEVSECGRRGGNFCGQEKSLLFMGRLHPVKGLPLLLEAWAKVTRRGWKLRIAGPDEGGHQTELQRLVGALGIQDSVEFLGPVWGEAKEQMFLESDLFVLPTYSENFGIAVAEAMAYGLPVITTHGAPWKVLEEEGCGWWVPVSVEGIAAALEDALRKEPEELAGMGALGRKIVAERFAWSAVAEQFLESYRWLLGRGGKPAFVLE